MNARLETLSIAELDLTSSTRILERDLALKHRACKSLTAAVVGISRPSMIPTYDASSQPTRTLALVLEQDTGTIPDADFAACTAVLLMRAPDDRWDSQHDTMITYVLLIKEVEGLEGEVVFERIGIGRTVDLLEGRTLDNTWLKNTQRRTFMLR